MVDINNLCGNDGEIQKITNLPRFITLIKKSIRKLELNLDGLVVLTEAASGNYVCTPIIAALAGAKEVKAFSVDSKYGSSKDIFENTAYLSKVFGIGDRIEFIESLDNVGVIETIDIVTNLGPLRPIKKDFIKRLKKTAVIPLMREPWEFRDGEIDLKFCKKKEIIVLGTNENHPDLLIFDYLGPLCSKKLFDLNIEILNSKIVVIGGGVFGLNIAKYLVNLGSKVKIICDEGKTVVDELGAEKIGVLKSREISISKIKNCDAIVVLSYPNKTEMIGPDGIIDIDSIESLAPTASIIQFKGNVNRKSIERSKIPILPEKAPNPGHMSWTLNDLGPKPVIDLHTAGLKVGEISSKARLAGKSYDEAINLSLKNSITLDFDDYQKEKFFS